MPHLLAARRVTMAAVVCVLLIAASSASVGATTTGTTGRTAGGSVTGQDKLASDTFTQQNNSTVHQENPENVDENGNLLSVKGWLAGQMSQTLINCTEGTAAKRYGACDNLDKKYPNWLGEYVDVNREIDSQNGNRGNGSRSPENNTSASFQRAKDNQQQFVSIVKEFNKTRSNYEHARKNGSTRRTRRRGRRLLRLARQANNTSANLTGNYRTLGNTSEKNVTGAITTINNTTSNITTIAANVSAEQFVNTTLTATATRKNISFRHPLSVNGQLTRKNGTPLSNRRVVLHAGNYSRTTTTDESGNYSITYRPALVSLATQNMTVQYTPRQLSPYLSDEATMPVNIEQVKPVVTFSVHSNQTSFNELVIASGRVRVGDTGAPSVPVVASIDNQRLDGAQYSTTTPTGRFRTTGRLPADVSAGTRTVRLSVPLEGRALAGTTAKERIRVTPTPTKLSISAPSKLPVNHSNATDRQLTVSGRLTTENGRPVANRSIELRIGGTAVGEVRTDTNGTYTTNASVPPGLLDGKAGAVPTTLVAVYKGQQSSLQSSRAKTRLALVLPERGFVERLLLAFSELSVVYQLLFGVGILLVGIVLVYAFRRRRGSSNSSERPDDSESAGLTADSANRPALIDIARRQLSAGDTERAILTGYSAMRERLGAAFGVGSTRTHWEFFEACRTRVPDGRQLDSLRRLTEAYERAAFAPQTPSEETAAEALEHAHQLEENAANDDDSDIER